MARQLIREGLRDVRVLEGGWRAWLELGASVQVPQLPVAAVPPSESGPAFFPDER